ncbi:MAG: NAD-dependent epimerase/dehydratase family protein [Thermoplasmata archaeon]
MRFLVYGHNGWIGSYFCNYVRNNFGNIELFFPRTRADDIEGVRIDLDEYLPDRVLSFIGRTSGPGFNSIDYLEQKGKLVENIRDNLFSPLVLMKLCYDRNIHFTYLGTGCIFSYNHDSDPAFTENSKPNFFGSSYSIVKGFTDQLTQLFPNTLNVRIRMPISEKNEPRNFISKIIRYPKICNTLNSMSILPDMIPILFRAVMDKMTGTINLVNPGPTDHNTILKLYQKYIDPDHRWTNISEEEQDKMLLAKRSKNVLVPTFNAPNTIESIERIFKSSTFRK